MSRSRNGTLMAARVVGGCAAALWLIPLVGSLFGGDEADDAAFIEGFLVVVLAIANIVGVAVAWFDQRRGGAWLVVTGFLFCVFAIFSAGRNHALAVLVSGGPFLLSGIFFLKSAPRHRRETA